MSVMLWAKQDGSNQDVYVLADVSMTEVVCGTGYYLHDVDGCTACTDVTNCDVTETCTSASNSQCATCADGTYADDSGDATVCTACTDVTNCDVAETCTSASDSQCATCADGTYADDS